MRGRVYVRGSIISIHALLTESDSSRLLRSICSLYFYPRSPYGERLFSPSVCMLPDDFYPRSPYGERRERRVVYATKTVFLSTLSLRRATRAALCKCLHL